METETRLSDIRRAESMSQSHRAMEGFCAEAAQAHPGLGKSPSFYWRLEGGMYSHALIDLEESVNGAGIEQIDGASPGCEARADGGSREAVVD